LAPEQDALRFSAAKYSCSTAAMPLESACGRLIIEEDLSAADRFELERLLCSRDRAVHAVGAAPDIQVHVPRRLFSLCKDSSRP